ncbi:MAG: prolyl oligopeptidase family serine peptidase [Bacteroidota bacterium]
MKKYLLLTLVCLPLTFAFSQNQSTLQLKEIMKGHHFVGHLPENIQWSDDSETIYFRWNPEDELLRAWYKTDATGNTAQKLSLTERQHMPSTGSYNRDRTHKVYSKNGDLFLLDLTAGTQRQITNTIASEYRPSFAQDEQTIFYVMDNNAYAWSIADGTTTQLSNFKKGYAEAVAPKLSEQEQWLLDDQLAYFDILQLRKEQRAAREVRREEMEVQRPSPIYLEGKNLSQIQVSPDGRYITYSLTTFPADSKRTRVTDFVTEQGYLKDINARPKVGSPQPTYEMGIYDRERDSIYLVDVEQIEGIYDKPAFLADYTPKDSTFQDQYEQARSVIVLDPIYNAAGTKAVVVVRAMDNKDRWIMELSLENAELKLLDRQRDEAWVGGPGIGGWNFSSGNIGWLKDNKSIWFQSEATGFSHLYALEVESGKKQQLTSGKFEIIDAQLSNDKTHFYFTSNRVSPAEHHFYKMNIASKTITQLTSMAGNNRVVLSPDETQIALLHSFSNKPWELHVMPNKTGAKAKKVTDSTTDAFKAYDWRVPEIISFKASDGVTVPARLYRAKGGAKEKPAVIFVHGAGYLQNVHRWWSSYFREYMFHNLLADNGYTVLDIDYRASNGYGRDWRTAIYRHMGGKDLSDQVDGAKYLVDELGVDGENIGIYGGSYGGFISIFAMFNHNDVFKCGAALRSVTDWAHYNHGYTSNILNTPVEDPIAFKRSAPIYFADNFDRGELLMLHGMIDDNVQFQDVVRLSQRLIELGKTNWDVAIFPVERHGFVESSSWADEYRRIYELFERNLK